MINFLASVTVASFAHLADDCSHAFPRTTGNFFLNYSGRIGKESLGDGVRRQKWGPVLSASCSIGQDLVLSVDSLTQDAFFSWKKESKHPVVTVESDILCHLGVDLEAFPWCLESILLWNDWAIGIDPANMKLPKITKQSKWPPRWGTGQKWEVNLDSYEPWTRIIF